MYRHSFKSISLSGGIIHKLVDNVNDKQDNFIDKFDNLMEPTHICL